jgi:hypothetical protein
VKASFRESSQIRANVTPTPVQKRGLRCLQPFTSKRNVSRLPAPNLRHLCDLKVHLDSIRELGMTPEGQRRIIPIIGGTCSGERLQGTLLHVGADWQCIRADDSAELDARYALQTQDGALIEIRNHGYRHGPPEVIAALAREEAVEASCYYMRTMARLVTGDPRYDWVNRILCVGTGARQANSVEITLYEIE